MDKQGKIHRHSKEKLAVYREYLLAYLLVMIHSPKWNIITIIDLFAGMGVSKNEDTGSALIAAKVIDGFRKNPKSGKVLQLFLNEFDPENHSKLKENLSQYDFPKITNQSANDFVGGLFAHGHLSQHKAAGSHSLLFIDPHGYTQLSPENLNKVFASAQTDIMIFVPTNAIYRFAGREGGPASRFLLDFGITEPSHDLAEFAEKMKDKIQEKANTCFVYSYGLKNKNARNSLFHLFFVTKHILGARKFLEAKTKIKEKLRGQLALFDPDEPKKESGVRTFLSQERSNAELYVEIITMGYLPKEMTAILKSMEKSGELEVRGDNRQKGAFYLKEKSEKTIHMRIINHERN